MHYDASSETFQAVVQKELNGSGKLLGCRALNQKLRMQHELQVPGSLLHKLLENKYPEGLYFAAHLHQRMREKAISLLRVRLMLYREMLYLQGHEKLGGYQNLTFPLGIYGCLDTYSRKMLFLYVSLSN